MKRILQSQLKKVEEEYTDLLSQRGNAGPEIMGSILNRIERLKKEKERLLNDIKEEEEKYNGPEDSNIICYVIVSTKKQIKEVIGESCFCKLEDDRYHETECNKWKPYYNNGNIEEILKSLQEKYPFMLQFIDSEISDAELVAIDKGLNNSIAVIDLLSLNDNNKSIALKFDTNQANLLLPICRTLHPEIYDLAIKIKSNFKTLKALLNLSIPCSQYFSNVSDIENFKQHLITICSQKFKIKKTATNGKPSKKLRNRTNMIISFYSYKGGVGRSQLCANVASYLCHKRGKKVLLWDWDFEAPGLHYFFGLDNKEIVSPGTIEMLDAYCDMMRTSKTEITESDIKFLDLDSIINLTISNPVKIKADTQTTFHHKIHGKVDLIPGG